MNAAATEASTAGAAAPAPVRFADALGFWLKLGFTGFILIALSWFYLRFGDVPAAASIFFGLKPAVTALVLHAAAPHRHPRLENRWMWDMAAASFIAIFASDAPFPAIVLAGRLIGHFGGRRRPRVFALGGGHGGARSSHGPSLIYDHTPAQAHARFSRGRPAKVLGAGLGFWLLTMAALVAALFRFKAGVIPTLSACVAFGLLATCCPPSAPR